LPRLSIGLLLPFCFCAGLLLPLDDEDDEDDEDDAFEPEGISNVVRMWCTREQMRALSLHAIDTVKAGRPDAKQNGRIIYYWT